MTFSTEDRAHMARALELARQGLYSTTPNPRVGCVLVSGGAVVGEGWHRRAGAAHAEALALAEAGARARGATAYVTLEPCSHQGRTPPCADALIAAGVGRVVAAMQDPNPLVAGAGLARLRAAAVDVGCGLMADEARELNIGFVSRFNRGRPWTRAKIAATLDGRTALGNGLSQWITGEAARADGHAWRARSCAMLTGIGTVRDDDPRMTVRHVDTDRQPLRVVVDNKLEITPTARILDGGNAMVVTGSASARNDGLAARGIEVLRVPGPDGKVDLRALLENLAGRGCNEVLVEAGARLNGVMLRAGLLDEVLLYLAPSVLGDQARGMFALPDLTALDQRTQLEWREVSRIGGDLRIIARPLPAQDARS